MSQRFWKGWFALHKAEEGSRGMPYGVSRQYEFEIPPGPDELSRATDELHRRWSDDGTRLRDATVVLPKDQVIMICPHLECWSDGRLLQLEEVEALSPTTSAGKAAPAWRSGRIMLRVPIDEN